MELQRENRTIVEVARAMLYDQDMPKFLWVEACNTVVYVQNRIPRNSLGKITPESVFTGRKLEVSHFKIFGSVWHTAMYSKKRGRNWIGLLKRGIWCDTVKMLRLIQSTFLAAGRL